MICNIIETKSPDFQEWLYENAELCIGHLVSLHKNFVKSAQADAETLESTASKFKQWVSTANEQHWKRLKVDIEQQQELSLQAKVQQHQYEIETKNTKYNYELQLRDTEIQQLKMELQNDKNIITQQIRHELTNSKNEEIVLLKLQLAETKESQHHDNLAKQKEMQTLNEQKLQIELEAQKQIHDLAEVARINLETQNQQFQDRIADYITKYTTATPAVKGAMAQSAYVETLSNLFPTADVKETHSQAHSCDISVTLANFEKTILFEIKNYKRNVPSIEILKFKKDLQTQKCHGVMISQTSGIATKKNLEIEIQDQTILVYLCNNRLDTTVINLAVNIIMGLQKYLSKDTGSSEQQCQATLVNEQIKQIMTSINDITDTREKIVRHLQESLRLLTYKDEEKIKNIIQQGLRR